MMNLTRRRFIQGTAGMLASLNLMCGVRRVEEEVWEEFDPEKLKAVVTEAFDASAWPGLDKANKDALIYGQGWVESPRFLPVHPDVAKIIEEEIGRPLARIPS